MGYMVVDVLVTGSLAKLMWAMWLILGGWDFHFARVRSEHRLVISITVRVAPESKTEIDTQRRILILRNSSVLKHERVISQHQI